jgi:hypothetical protein
MCADTIDHFDEKIARCGDLSPAKRWNMFASTSHRWRPGRSGEGSVLTSTPAGDSLMAPLEKAASEEGRDEGLGPSSTSARGDRDRPHRCNGWMASGRGRWLKQPDGARRCSWFSVQASLPDSNPAARRGAQARLRRVQGQAIPDGQPTVDQEPHSADREIPSPAVATDHRLASVAHPREQDEVETTTRRSNTERHLDSDRGDRSRTP